jgi:hypothetical protein
MCRNEVPYSECRSDQKDGYVDRVFGDIYCQILSIDIHMPIELLYNKTPKRREGVIISTYHIKQKLLFIPGFPLWTKTKLYFYLLLDLGFQMLELTYIPVSDVSHYIIDVICLGWLSVAI